MKEMKSLIFSCFFSCILTIFLSCSTQPQGNTSESVSHDNDGPSSELFEILREYNEQAPQWISPTVRMEKASLDFDSRMFEYKYTEQIPANASKQDGQAHLDKMRISVLENRLRQDTDGRDRRFLEILVKDNYGIRVLYILHPINDSIMVEVTPHEIDSLLQNFK